MTSVAEPVSPTEVPPSVGETVPPSPSQTECQEPPSLRSDVGDHGPERDSDSISIDSTQSVPDFSGRRMVTFDDDRMTTAYEAWELVCVEDRYTRQSWKSFCGINFVTRYVNHHDGCVYTNPVVSFDQGELADMHEDAISGYKHKLGTDQERAYEQDLANRVNDLPTDIYDQIQFLLDDKTQATNRNPYRRREWRVVVVQPGELRMTELLPERKRQSLFSWKKQPPVTRTYSVVIRGQEVKSTKEDGGWKAHSRHSNPWWRLDNRETKEEREQHKDAVKKMDRALDRRHQPLPPALRTRPVGPIRPPPRPAAGR